MNNCFLSIVTVLHSPRDLQVLPDLLPGLGNVLHDNFTDYEIILVNNCPELSPDSYITPLATSLKQHIYLLRLSARINRNHAVIAGLDRANGDYVCVFEAGFYQQPGLVLDLFQKTRENYDIVYVKTSQKPIGWALRPFYKIFYYILKHYSPLKVDEKALDTRIISLVAITSFTNFLRTLLLWIFLFSLAFLVAVVVNALKAKFTGVDLLGNVGEPFSGWTFLVVLISVFFAVTCLNLYIMSIYLSNIYNEIKNRPLYIIESIKRY